jgi:dipeptidyl aminopeptidase/acylaminoacyl peptidase
LRSPLAISCSARLIHGDQDPDVPVSCSLRLAAVLTGEDVQVTVIKGGDHRLSRPSDLDLMLAAIQELASKAASPSR